MTEQIFIRQFGQMPEGMKQEILSFFEYLLFKYKILQASDAASGQPEAGESLPKKLPKAGFLKGAFIMSDAFEAPLEDFKDYV